MYNYTDGCDYQLRVAAIIYSEPISTRKSQFQTL